MDLFFSDVRHLSYTSCDEQIHNLGYCRYMMTQYGRLFTMRPALHININADC